MPLLSALLIKEVLLLTSTTFTTRLPICWALTFTQCISQARGTTEEEAEEEEEKKRGGEEMVMQSSTKMLAERE